MSSTGSPGVVPPLPLRWGRSPRGPWLRRGTPARTDRRLGAAKRGRLEVISLQAVWRVLPPSLSGHVWMSWMSKGMVSWEEKKQIKKNMSAGCLLYLPYKYLVSFYPFQNLQTTPPAWILVPMKISMGLVFGRVLIPQFYGTTLLAAPSSSPRSVEDAQNKSTIFLSKTFKTA